MRTDHSNIVENAQSLLKELERLCPELTQNKAKKKTKSAEVKTVHSPKAIRLDVVDKLTDASYLTLSMDGYYFDATTMSSPTASSKAYTESLTDTHHDGASIIATGFAAIVMALFALASTKAANNKDLQRLYKYIRDLLSGAKNGRHATVNVYFLMLHLSMVANHTHGMTVAHMAATHAVTVAHYGVVNPIAIGVGLALAPALIHYRWLNQKRNRVLDANDELMKNLVLADHGIINPFVSLLTLPETDSAMKEAYMLALSVFNGITDGPYMFGAMMLVIGGIAGFGGLCTITAGAPVIALLVVTCVYTALTVMSSVYMERQRQKKLQRSAAEVKIEQEGLLAKSSLKLLRDSLTPNEITSGPESDQENSSKINIINAIIQKINSNLDENTLTEDESRFLNENKNTIITLIQLQKEALQKKREKLFSETGPLRESIEKNKSLLKADPTNKEDLINELKKTSAQLLEKIEEINLLDQKIQQLDKQSEFVNQLEKNIADIQDQKTQYKLKYGVSVGELKSRAELKINIEAFENDFTELCGITTESAEQKAFNEFLKAERQYLKKYHPPSVNDTNLQRRKSIVIDNHYLNNLKKSTSPSSTQIKQNPKELATKIDAVKHILKLKEAADLVPPPSLREWQLRYKTYCTEIIAFEKKLYRDFQTVFINDNGRFDRLAQINHQLEYLAKNELVNSTFGPDSSETMEPIQKISTLNAFFKIRELNKEKEAILSLNQLHRQRYIAFHKTKLLTLAKEIDDRFILNQSKKEEINRLCANVLSTPNSSSNSLQEKTEPFADSFTELKNIQEKLSKESDNQTQPVASTEKPSPTQKFIDINDKFATVLNQQRYHLENFSPGKRTNGNATFRCFRGQITGAKNSYRLMAALGILLEKFGEANKAANGHISHAIVTAVKYALLAIGYPFMAFYTWLTAKNQYDDHKNKIGARSPRLFKDLTINMKPDDLAKLEASSNDASDLALSVANR